MDTVPVCHPRLFEDMERRSRSSVNCTPGVPDGHMQSFLCDCGCPKLVSVGEKTGMNQRKGFVEIIL